MSSAVLDPLERSATTIRELRRPNGMLFTVAVGIVCLAVVLTALTSLDGRTLPGRNVWTKLWKFATAIATGPGLSHGGGYDHLPDGVSPADIHGDEPDFGDREFHTGTDTYRERHGHFP